jgi:aryl-phospho-beta-D-glucosidase BglC (GH1 family)
VAVSYRNKLMTLKWKDKRDVYMLISIHDDEIGTIHDKKCGLKQKPEVCTDYNDAMTEVDISDHYL